ncbi:MAG: hypothetical protein K0Q90_2264 [Paenibacillaceae bacterium]|jgi:hypothetical protein|nr:hypothetical protein [Paenibacillaceae bacterium]
MSLIKKPAVKKAAPKKPAVLKKARKPVVKQANPSLSLFTDTDFGGTRQRFRGNLGVRNLGVVGLDNDVESLQFASATNNNATLVLFADRNYQGRRLVLRGNRSVSDLADLNFENTASSFIMANTNLSDQDITDIQNAREVPNNFGEILAVVRKARAKRSK